MTRRTRSFPHRPALRMAALKLCREVQAHSPDNCVDGAAYFALASEVAE